MTRGSNRYIDDLRRVRSLLIVSSLQRRADVKCIKSIRRYTRQVGWEPLEDLLIERNVWRYAVEQKNYDPKLVFCHPDVLRHNPRTSLYYRGLCGLSLKAVKDYFGAVDALEQGKVSARLSEEKALKMAKTYNAFICSIISNSTAWTLDNGYRTVVATLGISLDGVMRNKVGEIAENRVRTLLLAWLAENDLLVRPKLSPEDVCDCEETDFDLKQNVTMRFGSEPDISFLRDEALLAVVEIKGGTDPAGALERYGAATKSFQHSVATYARCRNFYLAAVFTPELQHRIGDDRLVEHMFNIIEILDNPTVRDRFLRELFHHTLRIA